MHGISPQPPRFAVMLTANCEPPRCNVDISFVTHKPFSTAFDQCIAVQPAKRLTDAIYIVKSAWASKQPVIHRLAIQHACKFFAKTCHPTCHVSCLWHGRVPTGHDMLHDQGSNTTLVRMTLPLCAHKFKNHSFRQDNLSLLIPTCLNNMSVESVWAYFSRK